MARHDGAEPGMDIIAELFDYLRDGNYVFVGVIILLAGMLSLRRMRCPRCRRYWTKKRTKRAGSFSIHDRYRCKSCRHEWRELAEV